MGMSLGIGLGLGMARAASPPGLTCPTAIPLVSGVPLAVSIPADGTRWYRFTAPTDGVLVLDWVYGSGTDLATTIYDGADCDNLGAVDTPDYSANSAVAVPVSDGDFVWVKIPANTALTGTLTASLVPLPSISGVPVIHLWVPVNNATRLLDLIGGQDLVATGTPTLAPNYYPSGRPALQFNGTQYLHASGVSTTRQNVGVCGVWQAGGPGVAGTMYGAGADGDLACDASNTQQTLHYTAGTLRGGGLAALNQDGVILMESPASLTLGGGWVPELLGGGTNVSNLAMTGFTVGARAPGTAATKMTGYFGGCMVFTLPGPGGFLTNAQMRSIIQYWRDVVFQPRAAKVLVCSGDSIMSGVGLSQAQSCYQQIVDLLPDWSGYNVANPAASTQNCIDNDVTRTDTVWRNTQTDTVAILGGEPSNSIALYSVSGATCVTQVEAWAAARQAAGLKAIVGTMASRTGLTAPQTTARDDYNTAIRALYPTATANAYVFLPTGGTGDALVDIDAITAGAMLDGVHPNATRAAAYAVAYAFAVQLVSV